MNKAINRRQFKNKSPIAIPLIIATLCQLIVCILFSFRYMDGSSQFTAGNLVNKYDLLLIICSAIITMLAVFLAVGLAFTSNVEKIKPIGLLFEGILLAGTIQVAAGFLVSASYASITKSEHVYSMTIYILCSVFSFIGVITHCFPIYFWLKD